LLKMMNSKEGIFGKTIWLFAVIIILLILLGISLKISGKDVERCNNHWREEFNNKCLGITNINISSLFVEKEKKEINNSLWLSFPYEHESSDNYSN